MTTSNTGFFADNFTHLVVPLFVVAGLAERIGLPVGDAVTIVAVALSAFVSTPIKYFGAKPIAKALSTSEGSAQHYAVFCALNAAVAAASLSAALALFGIK